MFRPHFAIFGNVIAMCQIGVFQWNIFTIFLKVINIYLFFNNISES